MEVALRECLATAMWNANAKTGLRVSIVPLIQKVLNELLPKMDSVGAEKLRVAADPSTTLPKC
jgi:hypothetical protein